MSQVTRNKRVLRGGTHYSSHVDARVRTTRSGDHFSFDRGTATNSEVRRAVQAAPAPVEIENRWGASNRAGGRWVVDNPAPARTGEEGWLTWARRVGTAAFGTAGAVGGYLVGSAVDRATGGYFGDGAAWTTSALFGAAGLAVGRRVFGGSGNRQRPWDAGHTLQRALGGVGDDPEFVIPQEPDRNRGSAGRYREHREFENDERRRATGARTLDHTTVARSPEQARRRSQQRAFNINAGR